MASASQTGCPADGSAELPNGRGVAIAGRDVMGWWLGLPAMVHGYVELSGQRDPRSGMVLRASYSTQRTPLCNT